jgi:hypothetical protein
MSLASSAKLSSASASAQTRTSPWIRQTSGIGRQEHGGHAGRREKSITFSNKTYSSVQDVRDEMTAQLKGRLRGWQDHGVRHRLTTSSLPPPNSTLQLSVPTDTSLDPSSVLDFGGYASTASA